MALSHTAVLGQGALGQLVLAFAGPYVPPPAPPPAVTALPSTGLVAYDGQRGGYAVRPGWVSDATWQEATGRFEATIASFRAEAMARAQARQRREEREEIALLL